MNPRELALMIFLLWIAGSPAATAFTFEVVELSGCENGDTAGCLGEEITIGVRIANDGGDAVLGVFSSIFGYDSDVVSFVDGSAVSGILSPFCVPEIACLSGIGNEIGPELQEIDGSVTIFRGATLAGRPDDGRVDPGLDGVIGGGDAQFRATFRVTGPGLTTIRIGLEPGTSDLVRVIERPTQGAVFDLEDVRNAGVVIGSDFAPLIVPEPGVALLLGFGLAGFASQRKRRHRSL